jgi:hypothetical protein
MTRSLGPSLSPGAPYCRWMGVMSGSPISRAPRYDDGIGTAHSEGRTYRIVVANDGTYAVEIRPHDADAPLTISGFITEDDAQAWIREQQDAILKPP